MNSHRVHPIPCHVLSIGHSRARRDYPLLLALPTQLGHRPTTYPFPPGVLTQSIKSQKACTCSDPPPKKREAGGGSGGAGLEGPPRKKQPQEPARLRERRREGSLSLSLLSGSAINQGSTPSFIMCILAKNLVLGWSEAHSGP